MSFNCPPNIPFFPASYQATGRKPTLTVALENGDLLFLAFHGVTSHQQATSNLAEVMAQALIPIEKIITEGLEAGLEYGGIDASLNPGLAMQDSVVGGLENLFPHRFGAMGTLAAVAVATAAVRSVQSRVKLMGYSGLMLPVMEDAVLAARANADPPSFTVRDLVLFSSSCGVGLDMVPVAGDISVSALAALYLEVSALSNRLQCKPLAARSPLLCVCRRIAKHSCVGFSRFRTNAWASTRLWRIRFCSTAACFRTSEHELGHTVMCVLTC